VVVMENEVRPETVGGVELIQAKYELMPRGEYTYNVPADLKGGLIVQIDTDSDAGMKGLKPGDVVLRINDRAVTSSADLAAEVAAARKAGRTNVLLFVWHERHQAAVPIKIEPEAGGKGRKGAAK